MLVQLLLSEPD